MRKVIFSKRAASKLEKLLEYLESEWSVTDKKNFIIKLDKALNQITIFPEITKKSEIQKGLHQLILTRQTTLYYRADSEAIRIITLFDNRMDPKQLKKEI